MALQFVVGDATITLSREDIDKHPGSLLHSLVGSVTSSDGPVSFKVDALPDSPLATWPAAVGITTALYRQGYIEAGTLSRLLTQHTTADLYDRLKDLIDYLLLPGSVTKYLPARQQVPLLHASALDLHYQAAANSAVETMLLSTAFSNAEICRDIGTQRAAFFYLTMEPDSRNLVQVQVYAVGDSVLHSWKPPPNTVWDTEAAVTAAAATAQSQRQLLTLSSSAVALKLQESSSSRPSQFYNLVSSGGATKDCSTQLTSMVQSRLTTAVAAARATGIASSTVLQVCPIKVAATSEYRSHGSSNTRAVPVWVLYW